MRAPGPGPEPGPDLKTAAAREAAPAGSVSASPTADLWPRVKAAAGPRLGAMLELMTVREVTPRLLTLAVPQARAAMARAHLEEITRLVQQTGARGVSIAIVEVSPEPTEENGSAEPAVATPPVAGVSGAEDHPLVREAARVFGAKVTHVEPKRPGSDAS